VWASETNHKATTLLNTTISMIDKLEMNSLAEGIETEKQKQELIKMGCDYLQGYYFSKPLPQNEIMDFIEKGVQTK
jgi:EAL domain-containing protein (putative c-di-GMP-specific phosphodiesterase class I)